MTNNLLPKSQADNAHDLLNDVIAAIREEPKRFFMGDWLISNNRPVERLSYVYRIGDQIFRDFYPELPTCGTVGCIAGWVVALGTDHTKVKNSQVALRALELLGAEFDYVDEDGDYELDDQFGRELNDLFYNIDSGEVPQTPEYVEFFVSRIQDFMNRYEDRLKNTGIPR